MSWNHGDSEVMAQKCSQAPQKKSEDEEETKEEVEEETKKEGGGGGGGGGCTAILQNWSQIETFQSTGSPLLAS